MANSLGNLGVGLVGNPGNVSAGAAGAPVAVNNANVAAGSNSGSNSGGGSRMNGEIPSVPITTLAGIASLTDRKSSFNPCIIYGTPYLSSRV